MASTSSPTPKRMRSPEIGEASSSTKSAKQRRVSSSSDPKAKLSRDGAASTKSGQTKSLSSWLSIPPPPPLPEPFFMASPIFDRDSIFLGYALPLSEPSISTVNSYIARLPHNHKDLPDVVAGRGGNAAEAGSSGRGNARTKIKPNHNMWAYKCLRKKTGTSGTSDTDYEPVQASSDDGEQYGGSHLLKVLNEEGTVDVLVVCSRWFGGTMLGPIRFQHIEKSARAALEGWTERERLIELWREIEKLDEVIEDLRTELSSSAATQAERQPEIPEGERQGAETTDTTKHAIPLRPPKIRTYEAITDTAQLERLIKAKTMTVQTLINRVALQKP